MFWAVAGRGFRAQRGCKDLKWTHKRWKAGKGKDRGQGGKNAGLSAVPSNIAVAWQMNSPSILPVKNIYIQQRGKKKDPCQPDIAEKTPLQYSLRLHVPPSSSAFPVPQNPTARCTQTPAAGTETHPEPWATARRLHGTDQRPFPSNSWNSAWKRNQKEKPETQEMMSLSVTHKLYCDWYIYLSIHIYICISIYI